MWLFIFCLPYFTILAEKVLKYCKIRHFSMVCGGGSFPRGNWFTGCENTLHHRLTTQRGIDTLHLLDSADVKLQGHVALHTPRSAQFSHTLIAWGSCLIISNSKCVFSNFWKRSVFMQALSTKVKSRRESQSPHWRGLHSWNLSQWEAWRCGEHNPDPDFSGIFWLSPLILPNRVNNNNSTPS